ncbi:Nickel uptake substrate-specific transmembrane region [Caulifigura coniformis]|uniref:Nickel uptake substrate-specific transmembrane region n=1 Tax=Caulifigura coniformis TaxID=2527983 RepID=A0A517SAV8_9PLAN|nr:carboxypeptidase regulatory-like domain-containing protein [Caulifigura coniformis]QDT53254.1 Nickel uptake substrate-specific transmembrane region [Caulifigura coniformis]
MLLVSLSAGSQKRAGSRGIALFAVVLALVFLGITLLLQPATGSISGVVTDAESGAPVSDAEVRLFQRVEGARRPAQGQVTLVRTDAHGRYRFDRVAPGDYGIQAIHENKASHSRLHDYAKALITRQGSSTSVDLKLADARTLKVVVLSEDTGEPVPHATVQLQWNGSVDSRGTDAHGVAVIPGLSQQELLISAKAPGFQVVEAVQSLSDPLTDVEFKLPAGGSIEGKIVDEKGQPLAGVRVVARPGFSPVQYDVATSDQEGNFRLNNVPRSRTMEVVSLLENYQELTQSFALNGAKHRQLELVLKPRASGGDVEVTVVDAEGRPIAGAEIENPGARFTMSRMATTNGEGRATVVDMNVPPHPRKPELTIRAERFAPSVVKVDPSDEGPAKVTVTLEKGHTFKGRIVNDAGEPIPGARIYVSLGNRGGASGLATTFSVDQDGRFSATTLVPASTMSISARGYTEIRQRKMLLDQEEEQTIVMDGTGHYRAVIFDGDTKKPVPRFSARLTFATTPPPEGVNRSSGMPAELARGKVINDDSGRLFLEDLPNNSAFDLLIEADGYEPLRRSSIITSRDESDVHIELQPVDRSSLVDVAGVLLDQNKQPLKGVDIHLIGTDPQLVAQDPRNADIDFQTIRMDSATDRPACKYARGVVTDHHGSFHFLQVSNRLNLQLVYWGNETPATRVRDLEKKPAAQLGRLVVFAPAAVTVTGKIDLEKYPRPERILVQAASDHQIHTSEIDRKDRSTFSVSRIAAGELKVMLYGEVVPRHANGQTFGASPLLATKTITASSGETIAVNFD